MDKHAEGQTDNAEILAEKIVQAAREAEQIAGILQNSAPESKNTSEKFSAAEMIEMARKKIRNADVFAAIALLSEQLHLTSTQLQCVLTLIYLNHLEGALKPVPLAEGEGKVLRAAYNGSLLSQELFDFIVCGSLIAHRNAGTDYVKDSVMPFSMPVDCKKAGITLEHFKRLKEEIERPNPNAPWIQDCLDQFGKYSFSGWLSFQIMASENTLSIAYGEREMPSVVLTPKKQIPAVTKTESTRFSVEDYSGITLEYAKERLSSLVGREDVRGEMEMHITRMACNKARKEMFGLETTLNYRNMVFSGDPGVGKTTIASYVAAMMAASGLLKEPKAVFCSGGDLVGPYQGHTEQFVRDLFEEGQGGVIVIDEIDALMMSDTPAFQKIAINKLNDHMGRDPETVVFIIGYKHGTDAFLNQNQGLSRRLPYRHVFHPYDEADLRKILIGMMENDRFVYEPDVPDLAMRQILAAKARLGDRFGNAGTVRTIVDAMENAQALSIGLPVLQRICDGEVPESDTMQRLNTLKACDVPVFDSESETFKHPSQTGEPARPLSYEHSDPSFISYQ